MGVRLRDLRRGDRLWGPHNLDWDDREAAYVEFAVLDCRPADPTGREYDLVVVERGGRRTERRLDAEIGVCIVEEADDWDGDDP